MKTITNGFLIALEGIDGTGKTTLCAALAQAFSTNYKLITTKEPGATELGKLLRHTLLYKELPVCDKAEFLLFATDRAQHFNQIVLPHLQAGGIVISDRMADSSLVYQGYGRSLDINTLQMINHWAMNGRNPDLVLYLQLPAAVAYERMKTRNIPLNAIEQETALMHRLTKGFDSLFASRDNVVTLDAQMSKKELAEHAITIVTEKIKAHAAYAQ
ncbi:MAG: dTMP kinase [Proteobacteria bacterium]|nr:dTMP kinase [Pseudomonadota bacterium]NBP13879.1 dTMP kinase [bacterium]